MESRWVVVNEAGDILQPLNPLGSADFSFQRDLSIGLMAMRQKPSGDLKFIGADYEYFREIEEDDDARCEDILIRHDLKCTGRWRPFWTGIMSVGSGRWDVGKCTWQVRPEPKDRYTCVLQYLERSVNLLQIAPTTLVYQSPAEIEFILSDQNFNGFDDWTFVSSFVNGFGCTLYLNWRERTRTYCSGGSPSAPSTAGWTLLVNNCSTLGYADYTRAPTTTYTYGTPTAGTWVDYANNIAEPPDDSCTWKRVDLQGAGCNATPTESLPYYICFTPPVIVADTENIARARSFSQCAELILAQTGCEQTLVSDFFEINPAEDAPGYVSGDNYVTGDTNQVSNMFFYQLSDVLGNTTNAATKGEMTVKQFLQMLVAWQCFWFIDEDDNFRIEHYTYFQNQPITSLLTYDRVESTDYTYTKAEIPRGERLTWLRENIAYPDFKGADIIYNTACASNNDPQPVVISNVMTAIDYVRGHLSGDIPKTGFLLVACDQSNNILLDVGAITNEVVSNAPLSTANLFASYWTWNRLLRSGNMNGVDVTFDGFVPNIEQTQLDVNLCCEVVDIDLTHRFETELGNELGVGYALVQKADWTRENGRLSIKARYMR